MNMTVAFYFLKSNTVDFTKSIHRSFHLYFNDMLPTLVNFKVRSFLVNEVDRNINNFPDYHHFASLA